MSFEIRTATRAGVKPLIGLYGESGCGKTYSSLLLARGFVGPAGKIVLIDTESGRGSLYADVLPGGYEVLELREPFAPSRYIQALQAVEQSGATIAVIDSASHEWEGVGGVLDMATESEQRSGKPGLHNWKIPKMEHAKFMLRLLQSPLPIIVCLRAKHKTRQTKENGRTAIVKDDFTTPIQADDFIFEMTAHAEIMQDHSIHLTKCSHPSLRSCFPERGPLTSEHGALLAAWCKASGEPLRPAPIQPLSQARQAAPRKPEPAPSVAIAGQQLFEDVKITKITPRSGTTNGRNWQAWFIKFSDGTNELEAGTFSESVAEMASTSNESESFRLIIKPGKKPNSWEIVALEPNEVTP